MSMAAPPLALELVAGRAELRRACASWHDVLGLICYGDAGTGQLPCAAIPMPVLGGGQSVCDVWRGGAAPRSGRLGTVSYREDGGLLFGCLARDERATVGGDSPLRALTCEAYADVFAAADALGYPHLVRCWNYFRDINLEADGLERYRQFNIGRQDGFRAAGRALVANLPAACALGTQAGPLVVAFIAAREAAIQIENPRQVSAYNYPPEYGPRSPTFARASLLPCAGGEFLFVSGTASIVGHRTVHMGDAAAQTGETLANLQALIEAANRASCSGGCVLGDLALKVYVRDPRDLGAIRARIEASPDAPRQAVYLQADICRPDLLVEIEGTARIGRAETDNSEVVQKSQRGEGGAASRQVAPGGGERTT